MLPRSAIITNYLAKEYNSLIAEAILVRIEYQKEMKLFRYSFVGKQKCRLEFAFAPPHFVLLDGWAKRDDAFEIWLECAGSTVTKVTGTPVDRIITIDLLKNDTDLAPRRFAIVFELFGALANAFLLDEKGEILQATRVINDRRRLKPRMTYIAPQPPVGSPDSGEIEIARTVDARYLLRFSGDDYGVTSQPEGGNELKSSTPLTSLHQFLSTALLVKDEFESKRKNILRKLESERQRQQKLIDKLQIDLQESGEGEKYRRWGDILMANIQASAYTDKVTLYDFYNETNVDIPLAPGKNLIESATLYYIKARKMQRVPALLEPRIVAIQRVLSELDTRVDQIQKAMSVEQLNEIVGSPGHVGGGKQGVSDLAPEETSTHYRIFRSSAGEKILVGKSAAGNDVLTFKVARTYDLWFHAQQVTGSHVVLVATDKNRQPSRRSITEAAQLAAYYSDMRKSHQVPVIYTECRYVRKAKGGVVGKATYQQVKSIFVEPGFPPPKPDSTVDKE